MWIRMTESERIHYLCQRAGVQHDALDSNLVYLVESRLSYTERDRYVELLSAEVSTLTYRGLTEAQIQSPETSQLFYFNFAHIDPQTKASCLWHAIENKLP